MDLIEKVVIVTGAASGIGRASARMIAEAGASAVVLVDMDAAGLTETAKDIMAETRQITCDVTDPLALEALYKTVTDRFDRLDVVFNNAGIVSGPPPFPDTDLERIRRVVDIDLTSVIQSSALAIQYMRTNGGGVIINTASTGGLNPYLSDAPYAASKAGVIMFSRSCAELHEQYGIRVNAVCPGVTETPILDKTGGGTRPEWLGPIMEHIKALSPEDIGQTVLDIIKDDNMAGEFVVVQNEPR
ncbi:MAG: SDR family oxidoreductase [Pseudomonadales bacterium]|nr:SDR family oxidoreductase [Pseudomonadales bacterium]MBO7006818.1 SDR family oxidoreductase [Pseudomonadales bacterium]